MADQKEVISALMEDIKQALRWDEDQYVQNLGTFYDDFLGKTQAQLSALYSRMFRTGVLNYQDFKRLRVMEQTMKLIWPDLSELQQNASKALEGSLNKLYWDAYRMNAWALDQTTPPNIKPTLMWNLKATPALDPFLKNVITQQIVTPWKGSMFSVRLGYINNQMARQIQTMVETGAMNGWSIPELSMGLRDLVGVPQDQKLKTRPRAGAAKSRADMIARTEVMRTVNLAQSQLFDDNKDLITNKVRLAADDFRVCDECEECDGKTPGEIDDLGYDVELPAHPRCRCCWIPKLKTWNQLLGRVYGKGMSDLEHIDEYEMKYFDPGKGKIAAMTVTPYDKWLAAA
jgi:SPP1 gp7 family putative phage head morphogenesis protein